MNPKEKKVSIVYVSYDGVMDAVGRSQVLGYLSGLARLDVGCSLISFEKRPVWRNPADMQIMKQTLNSDGIMWLPLVYHKTPRVCATLWDICRGTAHCLYSVVMRKTRVIAARSYVAAVMASMVCLCTGRKFVFDMRGFWPDERVDAGSMNKNSVVYRMLKKLEVFLIRKAGAVIVLTERARKEILKMYPERTRQSIQVIPCCADLSQFNFRQNLRDTIRKTRGIENRTVILHAGSLIGWYMMPEMLDMFRVIKSLDSSALFMVLSGRSSWEGFTGLARKKNIACDDILMDEVQPGEMPGYISAADAGLFFITPTFSKMASCPIKLAEYLGCGLPIICNSGVGDLDDFFVTRETGSLVTAMSEDAYRAAWHELARLRKDQRRVRDACRKVACERLSLDSGVNAYLKVYERMVS